MRESNHLSATVFAGVPAINNALYHKIRFAVGDPAAIIELPGEQQGEVRERILIVRDIEMDRARRHAMADRVACPADFTPAGGLSGDRETATAQAVAECLARHGIREVRADRSMPLIFADEIIGREIEMVCDRELGVVERRHKDEQEIEWLRKAQRITEGAVEMACRLVATSTPDREGVLQYQHKPLTSERVRTQIDLWLLERGFGVGGWIIAGGSDGGDCHHLGAGLLRTSQPVIIDIFPQDRATRYHGDCTRTVVHGEVPDAISRMHKAVSEAKQAATAVCRAGASGEAVHEATAAVIQQHGYAMGLPPADAGPEFVSMPHGTGHGIGLDVHEPPLLDRGGPMLVCGDALTIEPGVYGKALGGVRIEDMVIVTDEGCLNLNTISEGLSWS